MSEVNSWGHHRRERRGSGRWQDISAQMKGPIVPQPLWIANGRPIVVDRSPRVMGIVNATPDSFSDGGLAMTPEDAIRRARLLAADGADLLDVGGESSRPGAAVVSVEEELRRVLPVIEAIRSELDLPLSIDTAKPEVARQAIKIGACIVNDIGGLRDPKMVRVVADSEVGVVCMHMRGTPRTMQDDTTYGNVVSEVRDYLEKRVEDLESAGIARERIAIDPGIGFGKTNGQSLELLRATPEFATLGCAVLIGISRKGVLGKITGRPIEHRATASAVSSLLCLTLGASVARVHDVAAMVDAIKVWEAIHGWQPV